MNAPMLLEDLCAEQFGPGTGLNLPEAVTAELFRQSVRRRFLVGETMFHASSPGDSVFLVCEGRVTLRSALPSGHSVAVAVSGPGDVVGLHAIFDPGRNQPVSAVAATVTTARVIRRAHVLAICAEMPLVTISLGRLVTRDLAAQHVRLAEMCWDRSDVRIRRRIFELVQQFGTPTFPSGISMVITHEEIAELSGVARPTVTAVLRDGARRRILSTQRGRITVASLAALRAWSTGDHSNPN